MQELRFVAVSEDGSYAVLAVPGRSARFTLPIDQRLRAVAWGQTSRRAQYEIEVESPLRPKEIQARIRAGETVEEIADAAGIAVERVRWFEGPVLAERAYMADQAQKASVRRQGDAAPGPRRGEIVAERLRAIGADPEDSQWDAKKRGDGSWQVQLTFTSGGRLHTAEWVFDPRRRHVLPNDDNAARMSLPGGEPPQPSAPPPGEATVTRLAPRISNARHERPAPVRSPASEAAPPAPAPSAPPPRSRPPGPGPPPGSPSRFPWWPRRACAKTIRLLPRPPPRRRPRPRLRPATQPRRPREAPSRPGARAAKRRAAGDPRSRPGTRSCSAVPASATELRCLTGRCQRGIRADSRVCVF